MELPRIHTAHAVVGEPTGEVALPAADLPRHDPPFLDRVGDTVREQPWLPLGALLLGGVGGGLLAARGGAGLLRTAATAIGAGAGGLALTLTAAGLLTRGERVGTTAAPEGAAAASTTVRADEDLRVMTYNVHGANGPQGAIFTSEEELDRLAETIRREQPDVVLLQELDRFAIRSNGTDTLAELAKRLDATGAVFAPRGTLVTGRQEGTGVLTFNGVEIADARGLVNEDPYGSDVGRRVRTGITGGIRAIRTNVLGQDVKATGMPDYFPRVTADAMLVTPAGNHVRVLSGHYNGPRPDTDYQGHQVAPVAGLIGAWDGPTILGADFNVRSGSEPGARERTMLADAGLRDAFAAVGVEPGDEARASYGDDAFIDLDRIYGSDHFHIDDVRVAPFDGDEPAASDHHPVVVDMRLEAAREERD